MKTIIFDCDGTLVDSEVLSNEVLVEVVAEHGLSLRVEEALATFRGGKMADCVAALEARLGRPLPADFIPTLRARTADAFRSRLRPVPGAVELIRSLSRPLCVASSGPVEKKVFAFQPHGVDPRIPGVVTVVKRLLDLRSVFA